MASAQEQELHSLLKFLSQDAKVPLPQALTKVKDLQAAKLVQVADIAKADFEDLQNIFKNERTSRQVLNAAKRVSKKRSLSETSGPVPAVPSSKRSKPVPWQKMTPSELEASLVLPDVEQNEDVLNSAAVFTNRAPLLLAFTVTLLKFTMPEQPLSSRLSLAQAVVSMNSKAKAMHIGIDNGKSADDEGWGEGQPTIWIMGREVPVMKRWGYEWEETSTQEETKAEASTQGAIKKEDSTQGNELAKAKEPALWGVDPEALKVTNSGPSSRKAPSQLPIYTAGNARAYLLNAFDTPKEALKLGNLHVDPWANRTIASLVAEKLKNVGMLLGALELLYQSWAQVLSKEDLDRRAWGWYARTRPDVPSGRAGWGGKGTVKLSGILEMRRPASEKKEV